MKTIKDIKNKDIREFLGCSSVFASYVKHGKVPFPRKKIIEFSKKFDVSIESLLDNKKAL